MPVDWRSIETPVFDLFLSRQFGKHNVETLYAYFGRLGFDNGELDSWEHIPVITGDPRSGISTVYSTISEMFQNSGMKVCVFKNFEELCCKPETCHLWILLNVHTPEEEMEEKIQKIATSPGMRHGIIITPYPFQKRPWNILFEADGQISVKDQVENNFSKIRTEYDNIRVKSMRAYVDKCKREA